MTRRIALCIAVVVLPVQGLSSQWLVGADVVALRHSPVAEDTASGGSWTTLTVAGAAALRVERNVGRTRIGLGVLYARSGFAAEDRELAIEAKDVFRLWEFAPELGVRIAGVEPGTTAWVVAGPVIGIWVPVGDEVRVRTGLQAGAALGFPLVGRIAGAIRVLGSLTPSPFEEAELTADTARRAPRRLAISVGFRYRL